METRFKIFTISKENMYYLLINRLKVKLPEDFSVVGFHVDWMSDRLEVCIHSESFPVTVSGQRPEYFFPELEFIDAD